MFNTMSKRTYKTLQQYLMLTGQTQADLADRMGVTRAAVSAWVLGKRLPQPAMALKLSKLGIRIESLYARAA